MDKSLLWENKPRRLDRTIKINYTTTRKGTATSGQPFMVLVIYLHRKPSPARVAVFAFHFDGKHKSEDMECQSNRHSSHPLVREVRANRLPLCAVPFHRQSYHNSRQNATETELSRRGPGFFLRCAIAFCGYRAKCTKRTREVWRRKEKIFRTIYLKISWSVVLSL